MNRLFQSTPISPEAWGRIVLTGIITYFVVEGEKKLRRGAED